jgi:pimeloyl-ACP methyl ester carboxylesterase
LPCIQIPSGNVHFLEAGSGRTPIVFVHGFCQASVFWQPTLGRLPDGYHGFALDLMGFGDSEKPERPYNIPGYADDVLAFADALGLDQFVLAGNSMGGVVCQSFATRHGLRLLKLVLVSTGPFVRNPAAALAKADQMDTMDWDRGFFESVVSGFFVTPPADTDSLVAFAMGASRRAMVDSTRSSASSNFVDRLHEITVPTLIVQGEKDTGRTPEDGRMLNESIAGSELHVVPEAGHTPMLECPEAFYKVFLRFLGE